ncbi:MAG: SGNH/GDSL hydrolase family protein [Clostridia bacterium]|nr:SGNH/GDSL hydrolase family protein [Clostridia bacterium]
MRRIFKYFIVFTLVLCLFTLIACTNKDNKTGENQTKQLNYLVLGDSIAEGFLGPSPLSERDNYTYCSLIGKINNYSYHNRAVSGHLTKDFLSYVSREEDQTAYISRSLIINADIIEVSIIGNDLLQSAEGLTSIAKAQADNNTEIIESICQTAYNNIDSAIKKIKELNSDVVILMQTLYNPYVNGSTLFSKDAATYLESKGKNLKDECQVLINRVNKVFFDYLEANPGSIYIVDVAEHNKQKTNGNPVENEKLMYPDDIHPSNEGHANILDATQKVLEELGLADKDTALNNYKNIRIEQLNRLYSGTTVAVSSLIAEIQAAKSIDEVNTIYFDNTRDVTPIY